ncbi:GNAT family N-acetyltransferase [Epibacterium sp. SM1979]|uniref:GNAT family N-acetyltransferase n=1 Tax=Tritonibacter litoralis TaxID=2662264 RepID=A0A843YC97_9RHOB|nr:GNAT family N-acetyltransferase [Tritonibacter litoralis]MQQ08626.1 GNAT family N-acetyltransferase [Tritonibacter litoralis]
MSLPTSQHLVLSIPTLTSERLVLRPPVKGDFENVAAFFADSERSWGFGGPLGRNEAWRWFASMIGHWALRGFGWWMVDTRDGQPAGFVGLWEPEGWPEPELGWVMFPGTEGKGYAFEAATEARRYAYDVLGFETLSSNIIPGNTRSIALAKRLGAHYERSYENVTHGTEWVYRHPAPEALKQRADDST